MQEYPRKSWWCQEVGPSKSHAPSCGDQLSPCQPTGKLLPPGGRGGITPGCSGGSGGAQLPAELLGAPCPLSGGRGGMPGAADSRSGSGMGERQPSPPSGPDRCRNKCSVGSSTSLHFRPGQFIRFVNSEVFACSRGKSRIKLEPSTCHRGCPICSEATTVLTLITLSSPSCIIIVSLHCIRVSQQISTRDSIGHKISEMRPHVEELAIVRRRASAARASPPPGSSTRPQLSRRRS